MKTRLTLALLACCIVVSLAQAPVKIGPWVGLRLWIYDYSCKCNRLVKLAPGQSQIDSDPAGTSDGIWTIKDILTVGAALPNATVGAFYSQSLVASGGVAPYTWAVTAGALPTGLTLGSNGILSGTPTQAGLFTVTVTVTDTAGKSAAATFTSSPRVATAGTGNYVGGPTGAIVVRNDLNPPEIDIATEMVPQKHYSETIYGKWTFVQP